MSPREDALEKRIQHALGAERVIPRENLPSQGPLDLLQLRTEVGRRLHSSGERPTDPDWELRRVLPFKREGWAELERLATICRQHGQSVSPSQLAALLIEHGLEALKRSKRVKA